MSEETPGSKVMDFCPHCGRKLSPWEHILLSVDRALMCKGCWYRIILDIHEADEQETQTEKKDE